MIPFRISALLCFAVLANSAERDMVIVDHLGTDHSTRRETRIRVLRSHADGKITYQIDRKLLDSEHKHFSKQPPPYVPAFGYQEDFVFYPGKYSRTPGADTSGTGPVLITFDESVEVALQGELLDDLIGGVPTQSGTATMTLARRRRTNSDLGLSAPSVTERIVTDSAVAAKYPQLVVPLGPKTSGFVGCLVDSVAADGPAFASGIQRGDVIVQLAGRPVNRDRKLEAITDFLPPGQAVDITFVRRSQGQLIALSTKITPRPIEHRK